MNPQEWKAHMSRENSRGKQNMRGGKNVIDLDSRRPKTEINWTGVIAAIAVAGIGLFIFRSY